MSCNTSLSWNISHLRGHFLQGAPDSISKLIYYSACSEQVSSKRYHCASCHTNLPVKSANISKQSLLPACLGPTHVCVTSDIPKALVPLETPKKAKVKVIEWILFYLIKYIKKMFSVYWAAAMRIVTMCTKIKPESPKPTQSGVNKFNGIGMTPVRPKRKEKPVPQEIPDPGMPGESLPGCPIPGLPDVAIPIVPELPMPDMPEIPLSPQVPGKPKPKGRPLPGDPVPILQDMLRQRWPSPILRDLIRQRFPVPAPPFQDASITLSSPFIHSPLERNMMVQNVMRSNIRHLSLNTKNDNRKIEIPKRLIVPPTVTDLLKNDKVVVPKKEIICTLSKLTPAEIEATFNLIKMHREKLKETQEMSSEFIFGMTFEQCQELFTFMSKLKKQENPSQLIVNKLHIPSELFIKNSKFLDPIEEEQFYKGIFTGKIQIRDRKYIKRF